MCSRVRLRGWQEAKMLKRKASCDRLTQPEDGAAMESMDDGQPVFIQRAPTRTYYRPDVASGYRESIVLQGGWGARS